MQVAAANPSYVAREDVPGDVLEKEREIYRDQMADQKKPPQVIDKIVEGKLEKFFAESCLWSSAHQGPTARRGGRSSVATRGEDGERVVASASRDSRSARQVSRPPPEAGRASRALMKLSAKRWTGPARYDDPSSGALARASEFTRIPVRTSGSRTVRAGGGGLGGATSSRREGASERAWIARRPNHGHARNGNEPLALQDALERSHVDTRVLRPSVRRGRSRTSVGARSGIPTRDGLLFAAERQPVLTTDTAGALRAVEIDADAINPQGGRHLQGGSQDRRPHAPGPSPPRC